MRRAASWRSVVLPAPVEPMMAVVSPGATWNDTSSSTACCAPGWRNVAPRNSTVPGVRKLLTGWALRCTDVSVSSTSTMRVAATPARGIIDNMNVANITALRICIM